MIYSSLTDFVSQAKQFTNETFTRHRFADTRRSRILRRFSHSEVADILGCDRTYLYTILKHKAAPQGTTNGREKTFSVNDIMLLRAIAASNPKRRSKNVVLPWRNPGDPLPVITVHSLKGGTAKSATSANLAVFSALYMGLRVAVLDGDPQATCSLYFVDEKTRIIDLDVNTFVNFMGLQSNPARRLETDHDPVTLNSFWKPTPWPGIRLLPGGASIQVADTTLHNLTHSDNPEHRQIFRLLRDSIKKWDRTHPPKTRPEDLVDSNGNFDKDKYLHALNECADVVIIDTAPSMSLAQINAVMACDTLVIPQTMRGLDLSTLSTYLGSLDEYLRSSSRLSNPVNFGPSGSVIQPTLVNTHSKTDLETIGEFYETNSDFISPVYSKYLEAAANSFQSYMSPYEYVPLKSLREGLKNVISNANAVSENLLHRAIPNLPNRGFADEFITNEFGGAIPTWAEKRANSDL